VVKKRSSSRQASPLPTAGINQKKRDRVAAILAIMLGLLSVREGGSVLLGVTGPDYPVLTWLIWYNVAMGVVSVAAGVGIWKQQGWSSTLAVNILVFHGVVFTSLFGMYQLGQSVAERSILAMLIRTFTWVVIYSLLRWNMQKHK
jgi:hypothetical protein